MPAVGTLVAGFRIDARLGRGGMGVVYRATQLSLNREVALKLISPELSDEPGFAERFRREGMLQAGLDHPNIVPVYEAGDSEHGLYIAMQLVRGTTLKELVLERRLDARAALEILGGAARGLDAAHAGGLIHRDVKPHNILVVDRHGYLADFGLSRAPGLAGSTGTGRWIGTLDYASPEQIRGEPAGPSSDIYALGAVVFECLTGSVPFPRPSEIATMYAHLNAPPPSAREIRAELPEALDRVIARALSKQPEERHQSASELVREAADAIGDDVEVLALGPPAPRPSSPAVAVVGDMAERETTPRSAAARAEPAGSAAVTAALADAPAGPVSGGRARMAAVAVFALAAVGAAVGGYLDGRPTRAAVSARRTIAVAQASVQVPAGWRPITAKDAPVYQLVSAPWVAAGPTGAATSGVLLARAPGRGDDLLPGVFHQWVGQAPLGHPARSATGLRGLLYPDLRSTYGRGQVVTVLTIPTTDRDVVVACFRPRGDDRTVAAACPAILDSVRLLGGSNFALEPRPFYRKFLLDTLGRLLHQTAAPLGALAASRKPAAQAAAADTVAAAYRGATTSFNGVGLRNLSPQDYGVHFKLRTAMKQVALAYAALAAALKAGDRAAWRTARDEVTTSATAFAAELDQLRKNGYDLV
jgi:hypothetical protein